MTNKIHTMVNTIQSRSLETRKIILMVGSIGLTALIGIIWLASFAITHAPPAVPDQTGSAAKPSQSPFAIIKDNVVELYATATKGYDVSSQK